MPTKRLVSKRARRSPPPPVGEPNFFNEAHKTRYALLSRKPFGTIRRIEWEALRILGLQNTAREYISHGGWDKVFEIEEPTFRELTLEVLSTIEVTDHRPFTHQASSISFRAFGKNHRFSQDQLSVYLGLLELVGHKKLCRESKDLVGAMTPCTWSQQRKCPLMMLSCVGMIGPQPRCSRCGSVMQLTLSNPSQGSAAAS